MPTSAPFRFREVDHAYILEDGRQLPSITQMLKRCGYIDDRFHTEDASQRGTTVHRLCADFDLGALDPNGCTTIYTGYLRAYVTAVNILRPTWTHIEEPMISQDGRWAGTPDRVGRLSGVACVLDIKSGGAEPWHPVQLALQAILVAPETHLPPETIARFGLLLKANGRFMLEQYDNRRDFQVARDILRQCCG